MKRKVMAIIVSSVVAIIIFGLYSYLNFGLNNSITVVLFIFSIFGFFGGLPKILDYVKPRSKLVLEEHTVKDGELRLKITNKGNKVSIDPDCSFSISTKEGKVISTGQGPVFGDIGMLPPKKHVFKTFRTKHNFKDEDHTLYLDMEGNTISTKLNILK